MGPDTLVQHANRISPIRSLSLLRLVVMVLISFLEGWLQLACPLTTFTAHVPQMPAPPQLPTIHKRIKL